MRHARRGLFFALVAALLGVVAIGGVASTTAEADDFSSPYKVSESTVDLGTIEYDSNQAPAAKTITLHDQSGQNAEYVLADLTYTDTPYFSVQLSSRTMQPNGDVTVTITPKTHVKANIGPFSQTISWMPQLSGNRVPEPVTVKGEVVKSQVNVTSINSVSRYYGQAVDYRNVTCNTNKGTYSMADLGLTIADNGTNLPVGTHSVDVSVSSSANREVTGNLKLSVTVSKATAEVSNVRTTTLGNGAKLDASTLSGTAINPYTKQRVEGTFRWKSPDEVMRCTSGTEQKYTKSFQFVPSDTQNYLATEGTASVTVLSSGGGPSGGSSSGGVAGDANLSVVGGNWTYDRNAHPVRVSTPSAGIQHITYKNRATGQTSSNAPVDAGTYDVTVTVDATNVYKKATASATITINQRIASLKTTGDAIQSRPYNGKTDAVIDKSKIKLDNVFPEDGVSLSCDAAVGNYGSENVGDYTVVIQCTNAKITGAKAGNYYLSGNTVSERSSIFKRPATVTFNGTLTKEYGETFTFGTQGKGYTIQQGSPSDRTGVLAQDMSSINLSSPGAAATASAGTYAVTALGAGANYDLQVNGSGSLQVTRATPHLMSASAGSGKTGSKLSSVPVPTVTYVNGHNGEPVPGTVAWSDPNQTIGTTRAATQAIGTTRAATQTFKYTFSPNNLANYQNVTGEVTVQITDKTPVNITPTRTAFTYDGLQHEVSVASNTAGAVVKTTYKPENGSWSSTAPTNVGKYDFKITADVPDSSEFADNEIDGVMTISPLTPTGQPKISGEGSTLSAYKLDASTITGVGGKAVKGTVAWDNPSATVKAGDKYAWTFKSTDANYGDAHGTIIPKQQENAKVVDKSQLQSALTTANTVLASAQVSSNGLEVEPSHQWVTNATNDVLLKAIASANNCMTEGGATQKMVDEALANLNTAMGSFKSAMQPGLKGTDNEAVEKQESSVNVPAKRYDLNPGDKPLTIKVTGTGNGELFAFSDNDAVATAVASGDTVTVTAVEQGTAVVTVSRAETATHKLASATIGIIVGEAPADYVPPIDESVDATTPATEAAPEPLIRVRNPYTNKHMLVSQREANALVNQGWEREGGYVTALKSETPVYRLYNPYTTEHLYTTDANEYDTLSKGGWNGEGISFYSDDNKAVQVHRLFNPYADVASAHHFTADENEYQTLLNAGWQDEGIGWHYVAA